MAAEAIADALDWANILHVYTLAGVYVAFERSEEGSTQK